MVLPDHPDIFINCAEWIMRCFWSFALVLIGLGGMAEAKTIPPVVENTVCFAPIDPPSYYEIDLVSTKKLPGTRRAAGIGAVTYARSPFGVALTPEGHYIYDLSISIDNLRAPRQGAYVAWITSPNLDDIQLLGPLDENMQAKGRTTLNKFLVVITREALLNDLGAMWKGPIALRGMSKSGYMHTMAGHGPFEQEPCANYGYQ